MGKVWIMHATGIYLAFALLLAMQAAAFAPSSRHRPAWTDRHSPSAASTTFLRATETLTFIADYTGTTESFTEGTTKEDLSDFLLKPDTRDIFLTAGGTRQVTELDMTPQFKEFWQEACQEFSSSALPNDNDKLLSVDSVTKFPGLKLTVTTANGFKEIYSGDSFQGLELLLVAERQESKGAPPIVWLHNKLTGHGDREEGVFYSTEQTKARSWIAPTSHDNGVALTFDVRLQIKVEFPAILLKLLPMSKEKSEEQGAAAIVKTIKKDVDSSLQQAYEKFIAQHSSTALEIN